MVKCEVHDFVHIGKGGSAKCADCGELADVAETGAARKEKFRMPDANKRQVGGEHYQGEIQHWDYAWSHNFDLFQYIITKWIERHKKKGGLQDLEKARHALDKYIEVIQAEEDRLAGLKAGVKIGSYTPGSRKDPARGCHFEGEEPGPEYVNQD